MIRAATGNIEIVITSMRIFLLNLNHVVGSLLFGFSCYLHFEERQKD